MAPSIFTSSATAALSNATVTVDAAFFRSSQGKLKIAQMVTLLISFLCVQTSEFSVYSNYKVLQVVTVWFLVVIVLFYFMHLFRVHTVLTQVNCLLIEYVHYILGTLLTLISSLVAAVNPIKYPALIAAAVFGFFSSLLLFMTLLLSFKTTFDTPTDTTA
ncbi:CKLF-like MARVEL transmembrane domain-containing protein 7 [Erpetoichthys calabaricus]|uniref:CKLF like MARVEL transmembrane domain containing 7 n=1 Tax=Erpetoichthys calabaricus TaxID=27687 RepID=A0A8C4T2X5_ERPCA|nr:CKLF-like MARVEL transmembrane domain-containing protein 7 [Erpetoichthys calabaricus]